MRARLHTPPHPAPLSSLLSRILLLLTVLLSTVSLLYVEGGLRDSETGEMPTILGTLYFTMVTITTVGYGDIVPVSTFARMTDTFFLTPMRFIVFVLFVGIAYELTFKRLQENVRMNRVVQKLKDHIIVCGYGENGQVSVDQLIASGFERNRIVVLDTNEATLDEAAKREVVTMRGDATKEEVLRSIAVDQAAHILVCPGRDDTAVLIALTASDINPRANIVAMCHEKENARLLERSGADTIVSPGGGYLIAAATRRRHLAETMSDLLNVAGGVTLDEREVRPDEIGKHPREIPGVAVLRVYRGRKFFNVDSFPELKENDILVYVTGCGEIDVETQGAPVSVT